MNRPNSSRPQKNKGQNKGQGNQASGDIVRDIEKQIQDLDPGLRAYPIRMLVEHAQAFGPFLRKQRLETNQIRKFLDAIKRVKAELTRDETEHGDSEQRKQQIFAEIEPDIVLLKPKLAYAAARQRAAKPLSDVMSAAIDKVHTIEDFERLVQFIESIIAYHKAEGGR